jgi:hypothetical protein
VLSGGLSKCLANFTKQSLTVDSVWIAKWGAKTDRGEWLRRDRETPARRDDVFVRAVPTHPHFLARRRF